MDTNKLKVWRIICPYCNGMISAFSQMGKFKFEQDDLILLQTDGVFETRNDQGEIFSSQRVKQLLLDLKDQEVAEINKTIISEVEKFQGGEPQQDDITLIAIKKSH